ncbi:unnamed protein product, partial [Heterosigma akashiwo]
MQTFPENFDFIKINLASPEKIEIWAKRLLPVGLVVGEITKTDTINYRTFKPETGGLFCEQVFGPIKTGACSCGAYKYSRKYGTVCSVCGVEITDSRVRRHRMGYINLLAGVSHVWYLKGRPSYLSLVLDEKLKDIEKVIYFNNKGYEIKSPAERERITAESL